MKFVGELLKKSRLNKKIDLKIVAKDLNIRLDLLKRIENNDFNEFAGHLNSVYLIGHIRAYAKFLGLNENKVIKQFKAENLIDKRDFIDELPKPLEKRNFNFYFATKTFSLFSITLISICFYFLFIRTNDMQPNHSILPDLPESLQSEIEQIEIQSSLNKFNKINSSNNIAEEITSKLDNMIINDDYDNMTINDDYYVNENSAIAAISKNDLAKSTNIITLKFLEPTWIQLRNKQDQVIFSKLMSIYDEYTYSISDNFTLTTGNAGNILVQINGNIRGKAGKKGEVIDSLVIDSDFIN